MNQTGVLQVDLTSLLFRRAQLPKTLSSFSRYYSLDLLSSKPLCFPLTCIAPCWNPIRTPALAVPSMAFPWNPEERSPGQSYATSRSSTPPTRPRPYSEALDDVLKKDFPNVATFEERLDILFFEYSRNYSIQSQRDPPAGVFSAARNTGSRSRSSPRANPASLQLNSMPHPSQTNGSNPMYFLENDGNGKKRKRRNYTHDEKVEVARIRKIGACKKCNKSHKKVPESHYSPNRRFAELHNSAHMLLRRTSSQDLI